MDEKTKLICKIHIISLPNWAKIYVIVNDLGTVLSVKIICSSTDENILFLLKEQSSMVFNISQGYASSLLTFAKL